MFEILKNHSSKTYIRNNRGSVVAIIFDDSKLFKFLKEGKFDLVEVPESKKEFVLVRKEAIGFPDGLIIVSRKNSLHTFCYNLFAKTTGITLEYGEQKFVALKVVNKSE